VGDRYSAGRRVGNRIAHVDRSKYHVERDSLNGETCFVVVSPLGDRLYSFSDLLDARAEAEALSMERGSSAPRAA
jgi:hypothetical protein